MQRPGGPQVELARRDARHRDVDEINRLHELAIGAASDALMTGLSLALEESR